MARAPNIQDRVSINVVLAAGVMALREGVSFPAVSHSLTGGFLCLLVAFRANSAHSRYWEARILWGGIMNTCRSLAIGAEVWIEPRDPEAGQKVVEWLLRYPSSVMRQCRGERLGEDERPADVCRRMHQYLRLSSEQERAILQDLVVYEQVRHVDRLVDATGALNRILKTPIPLSYTRHTSRFLTVWCGTLPLTLRAPPLPTLLSVGLISWLLIGIEATSSLLENPFSQPQHFTPPFDFGLPVESLQSDVTSEIERISMQRRSKGV